LVFWQAADSGPKRGWWCLICGPRRRQGRSSPLSLAALKVPVPVMTQLPTSKRPNSESQKIISTLEALKGFKIIKESK